MSETAGTRGNRKHVSWSKKQAQASRCIQRTADHHRGHDAAPADALQAAEHNQPPDRGDEVRDGAQEAASGKDGQARQQRVAPAQHLGQAAHQWANRGLPQQERDHHPRHNFLRARRASVSNSSGRFIQHDQYPLATYVGVVLARDGGNGGHHDGQVEPDHEARQGHRKED
jgi:hypothetical protein